MNTSVANQGSNMSDLFFEMRNENGDVIRNFMRKSDGYVNATQMCLSAGRKCKMYFKSDTTKLYLKELENQMNQRYQSDNPMVAIGPIAQNEYQSEAGIQCAHFPEGTPNGHTILSDNSIATANHTSPIVQIKKGGLPQNQGTWVHPQVAVHLAQWVQPYFAVKVCELVCRYSSGQVTTEESQTVAAQVAEQITLVDDSPEAETSVIRHEAFAQPSMSDQFISDFMGVSGCYLGLFDGGFIKYGQSLQPPDRDIAHTVDYPNFRIWAIVRCSKPKELESRFGREMRAYKADFRSNNINRSEVLSGIDPKEAERVMRRLAEQVEEAAKSSEETIIITANPVNMELEKYKIDAETNLDLKKHFLQLLVDNQRFDNAMAFMSPQLPEPKSPARRSRSPSPYRIRSSVAIQPISVQDEDDQANSQPDNSVAEPRLFAWVKQNVDFNTKKDPQDPYQMLNYCCASLNELVEKYESDHIIGRGKRRIIKDEIIAAMAHAGQKFHLKHKVRGTPHYSGFNNVTLKR